MCYHYAIKTEKKTLEQKTNLLFEDNNSWKSTEKINCFTLPMLPVVLHPHHLWWPWFPAGR
jgi:hypothetical protein